MPPLKHVKTAFPAVYKTYWFDTPGHRQRCGGFGEGFGKPKSSIFALFSMFFRSIFRATFWKAKKSKKIAQQRTNTTLFGSARRNARPPGERKREGGEALRCRRYRTVLGYSQDQALILKYDGVSSTPCTTYGGRRSASRDPPGRI